MGMYTECRIDAYLRQGTPPEIISMLRLMASTEDADMMPMDRLASTLDADLFKLEGWRDCLMRDSAYFPTDAYRSIELEPDGRIHIRALWNQKHYTAIRAFWEWLAPWVDCGPQDVVGHEHYEECESPTLITGQTLDEMFLKVHGHRGERSRRHYVE